MGNDNREPPEKIDDHGQPPRQFNLRRVTDRCIDELIGICRGVLADGHINEEEARFLIRWIEENKLVINKWPANIIYTRIKRVLADGCLDKDEEKELLWLMRSLTGGSLVDTVQSYSSRLPIDDPLPKIRFDGRSFCFTGKFVYGTRNECEEEVIERGGYAVSRVSQDLDYLIVGAIGSRDWIHSSYGRKIERAIELKAQGHNITIVPEEHWINELLSS